MWALSEGAPRRVKVSGFGLATANGAYVKRFKLVRSLMVTDILRQYSCISCNNELMRWKTTENMKTDSHALALLIEMAEFFVRLEYQQYDPDSPSIITPRRRLFL